MKRLFTLFFTLSFFSLAPSLHASRDYVANRDNNTVSVVDSATGQTFNTILVGETPTALVLSHDSSTLYICTSTGGLQAYQFGFIKSF